MADPTKLSNEATEVKSDLWHKLFGDQPVPTQEEVTQALTTPSDETEEDRTARLLGIVPADVAEPILERQKEAEYQRFISGVAEPLMTDAGTIELAASVAGGGGLPMALGRRYGGPILRELGTAAISSVGSSFSEEVANKILSDLGLREQKKLVDRGERIVSNTFIDMMLEGGVIAAGRLSGPMRELADISEMVLKHFDPAINLTRAFVDDIAQFNKSIYGGVGGNAYTAVEAYQKMKEKLLNDRKFRNLPTAKIFSVVEKRFNESLTATQKSLDDTITQVSDKVNSYYEVAEGKAKGAPGAFYLAGRTGREAPPSFDFKMSEFNFEGLYKALNDRSIEMFDAWKAKGQDSLKGAIDTGRGNTTITKRVREEIDNLYKKYEPDTFESMILAQKDAAVTKNKLRKLYFEQQQGRWTNPKTLAKKEAKVTELKEDLEVYEANIADFQSILDDITIPAEDLLNIRRGMDQLSNLDAKTADTSVSGRLSYESMQLLSNKFRETLGRRIHEIDPDLAISWANMNETYGVLKRVEPGVRHRALPDQAADNLIRRPVGGVVSDFVLGMSPAGAFRVGMEDVGSRASFIKPIAAVTYRGAEAMRRPLAAAAELGPGTASAMSRLITDATDVDIRQWAADVINNGAEAALQTQKTAEEEARAAQPLPLIDLKQERRTHILNVLQGASDSLAYAKKKLMYNNGTPTGSDYVTEIFIRGAGITTPPVEEEEEKTETPTIEMEDTGLGTKKRKVQ